MTPSALTYGWMIALVFLCVAFPTESTRYFNELWAVLCIKTINGILCARAFWMYLKLRRDFRRFGIQIPPFRFVPLQDREEF